MGFCQANQGDTNLGWPTKYITAMSYCIKKALKILKTFQYIQIKDLNIVFSCLITQIPSAHAPDVLSLGYHADETGSSLIILHIHTLGLCGKKLK